MGSLGLCELDVIGRGIRRGGSPLFAGDVAANVLAEFLLPVFTIP
jgi:hypothetical protein